MDNTCTINTRNIIATYIIDQTIYILKYTSHWKDVSVYSTHPIDQKKHQDRPLQRTILLRNKQRVPR
ncbi:hypothetical protein CHELA1G11_13186 [Hyphomicrobiales bacterium]|nr:hypothetical protein CHELA1G11_13186 [Hyphomicrobiales bacterium]